MPLGAVLSGALELGQALFLPERYASWTDVLANTAGTTLGALIGAAIRAATRRAAAPPPAPRSEPR
jgi:VanZ family protein